MATISEAARHIDLDERRFRELVDAGTITRASRGAYEIDRVRTEYIRSLREVAAGRARTKARRRPPLADGRAVGGGAQTRVARIGRSIAVSAAGEWWR